MTLGMMRQLGVRGLVITPDEIEVPSFAANRVCSRCGSERVDVQPNWTEMPIPPPKSRFD